ncbi:MAG: ferredoxin reductase [Gammaproteobacteria bacterium]
MSPAPGLPNPLRRLLATDLVAGLASPRHVDRYLELFNPLWSVDEVRAEVVETVRETADATTIRLRPNRNWLGARAGQYVRVAVDLDGINRVRCYSISSSACRADGLVDITVSTIPGGKVSGPLSAACPGMVLTLSQAEGDYCLPEDWPTHLVLVSGGSGITPNMAMVRTLLDQRYAGQITVLHYAASYDDVIFGGELVDLADKHPNLKVRFAVTRCTPDGEDFGGHFTAAHLDAVAPHLAASDAEVFVCGPQGLIDGVRAELDARGLMKKLHVEQFVAQTPAVEADAIGGEVRFARAERYVKSDGRTLLEQAEAAGLNPDSGCRMGICMACKCTKESGVTRNVLTGELSTEPNDDIQLCVSVPLGDVTLKI